MYLTTAEEFVSLAYGACLLFIYLGTFNNFGGVCVVPCPQQIINSSLEKGRKVNRRNKLIVEGRLTLKEKDPKVT